MEKQYDLEARTEEYAKQVILFCQKLPKNTINIELISQVVRAAGSIGANYIEANESLSKKDFANRIKICRKEAKECGYWLRLINSTCQNLDSRTDDLVQEAKELTNIFGAILKKSI